MSELTPELLLRAYAQGIFPMAQNRDDPELYWFDPETRGILPLNAVHLPRRLARTLRAEIFRISVDTAFEAVIRACSQPRPGHQDSWINERIVELYRSLFARGHCHSVECWLEERLVGGLYGVHLGAAFFGESMFSRQRDASKAALMHLIARLRAGGFQLLDTQFLTSHLAQFGGIEIPRDHYRQLLRQAVNSNGDFYLLPADVSGAAVAQSITEIS